MMDQPTISTVDVHLRKYAALEYIAPEMLAFDMADEFLGHIIARLVRRVGTLEGQRLQIPNGPWQMVKSRSHNRLIRWWTRRHPVQTVEYLAVQYLPNFRLPDKPPFDVRVASWEGPSEWLRRDAAARIEKALEK
jgi:hypothetical protein